jgi:hypothetical protein
MEPALHKELDEPQPRDERSALLIGEDIPPVRRATLRALGKAMRWWDARRMPD